MRERAAGSPRRQVLPLPHSPRLTEVGDDNDLDAEVPATTQVDGLLAGTQVEDMLGVDVRPVGGRAVLLRWVLVVVQEGGDGGGGSRQPGDAQVPLLARCEEARPDTRKVSPPPPPAPDLPYDERDGHARADDGGDAAHDLKRRGGHSASAPTPWSRRCSRTNRR